MKNGAIPSTLPPLLARVGSEHGGLVGQPRHSVYWVLIDMPMLPFNYGPDPCAPVPALSGFSFDLVNANTGKWVWSANWWPQNLSLTPAPQYRGAWHQRQIEYKQMVQANAVARRGTLYTDDMEGAASSYSSVGNRRVLDTGSMTWSRKEAARSPGRSHDLRGSQDFEPARRSEPVRYNCVMDFRPVRVLLGTLPEIELAEPGQNPPCRALSRCCNAADQTMEGCSAMCPWSRTKTVAPTFPSTESPHTPRLSKAAGLRTQGRSDT